MDPQYVPSAPQNNYDFLSEQPGNTKKPFLGSGNPKRKMLLSVLFIMGVLLIAVVVLVIFRSLTKKDYSVYKSLVIQQNEIVRIAGLGVTKARDSSVKNYSSTIYSVTLSEKNSTTAFVTKAGVKINEKELGLSKDADNDKLLAAAGSSNQYDQKLFELLNTLVSNYQKDIKAAASNVTTKSEKTIVVTLQNNANIIANAPTKSVSCLLPNCNYAR